MAIPPAKVLHELCIGSTQTLLGAAACALKEAKQDGCRFTEGAVVCLETAINKYNLALEKADLGDGRAAVMLQLGKAHGQRAMAEYAEDVTHRFPPSDEVVQHHIKLAAQEFEKYRVFAGNQVAAPKLLQALEKMVELCDANVEQPRFRRSLVASILSYLLGGEVSQYSGTRLPRAKMHLYKARQSYLQYLRFLRCESSALTPVYAELRNISKGLAVDDEDSLLCAWKKVQQHAHEGGESLAIAELHLQRGTEEDPELCARLHAFTRDLSESLRFFFHRAVALSKFTYAAKHQKGILLDSPEFEMQGAYDTVDCWRDATSVADSLGKAGVNFTGFENVSNNPDIELMCMGMHFLANMFRSMGMEEKGLEWHKQVVITAHSLDTSPHYNVSATAPWFVQSRRLVEEAQQRVLAKEERERKELLTQLEPEIRALQAARNEGSRPNEEEDDARPFLKRLLTHHPPKTPVADSVVQKVNDESQAIEKNTVMKLMTYYHPDKLSAFYSPNKTPLLELLLFTEIQKMFNRLYEKNWKN